MYFLPVSFFYRHAHSEMKPSTTNAYSLRTSIFTVLHFNIKKYVAIMKLHKLKSIHKERAREGTKLTFKLAYHIVASTLCLLHACLLI